MTPYGPEHIHPDHISIQDDTIAALQRRIAMLEAENTTLVRKLAAVQSEERLQSLLRVNDQRPKYLAARPDLQIREVRP